MKKQENTHPLNAELNSFVFVECQKNARLTDKKIPTCNWISMSLQNKMDATIVMMLVQREVFVMSTNGRSSNLAA